MIIERNKKNKAFQWFLTGNAINFSSIISYLFLTSY